MKSTKSKWIILIILLGVFFISFFIIFSDSNNLSEENKEIVIATTANSFLGLPVYVAIENNYFERNNLKVVLKNNSKGNNSIDDILEGNAQFAISSETPFVHSVLNGSQIYCIAILITGVDHLAIVSNKDRSILNITDLRGKKIGAPKGTNAEYFLAWSYL